MKLRLSARIRAILLLACAIGLVGWGAPLVPARPEQPPADLAAARARWSASAPPRYRLQVQERSPGSICSQDVEIRSGQIWSVAHNTCDHQPWTIDDLFARVAQDRALDPARLAACVVSGCACLRTPTFSASYDPQLGYPRERRLAIALVPNWPHRDFWSAALRARQLPDCDYTIDREVLTASVSPTARLAQPREHPFLVGD